MLGSHISEHEKECYFVQVYKLTNTDEDEREWTLFKHIVLNKQLRSICPQFHFKNKEPDTLIFTSNQCLYEFNFSKQRVRNIHEFAVALNSQPIFSV